MSDFVSPFWSYWIGFIALSGIAYMVLLLLSQTKTTETTDGSQDLMPAAETGVKITGHVWDENLAEYNHPLPRWWVIKFFLLIAFALLYLLLYPGLGTNPGQFGFTAEKQMTEELQVHQKAAKTYLAKYASLDFATLNQTPEARALGQRIFLNNCAVCHGSNAKGNVGFPNLSDKDWLKGGAPENIINAVTNGLNGVMPPFKEILKPQEISDAVQYTRSLSGLAANQIQVSSGKALFAANCASCHGADGKGNMQIGAPNLTDTTWLTSSSERMINQTISNGRNNVMPAQSHLSREQINLVASYVWGLSN